MAKTVFEQMDGSYVRQGDYELPAVTLPSGEETHVGIWGQRLPMAIMSSAISM